MMKRWESESSAKPLHHFPPVHVKGEKDMSWMESQMLSVDHSGRPPVPATPSIYIQRLSRISCHLPSPALLPVRPRLWILPCASFLLRSKPLLQFNSHSFHSSTFPKNSGSIMSSRNFQGKAKAKGPVWKENPRPDNSSSSVEANSKAGSHNASGKPNLESVVNFGGSASARSNLSTSSPTTKPINRHNQPEQRFVKVEASLNANDSTSYTEPPHSGTNHESTPVSGYKPRSFQSGGAHIGQKPQWVAKGYVTNSGGSLGEQGKSPKSVASESTSPSSIKTAQGVAKLTSTAVERKNTDSDCQTDQLLEEQLIKKGPLGGDFVVDQRAFTRSQIRATFYPKFENEKSDHEIRLKMIELVSSGKGTLEVSLKHSGSLFMYAGHEGGAYAKNSYGNIYTAVGVFVLGRTLQEAWGAEAAKKQKEFSDFLQKKRMCISMELVTAVLGDHGQRPLQDYAVVTAVTDLGSGKPRFYSTSDVIAFCRQWRLPSNNVWLFSTRKSVMAFFAAYDALCEEGTATPVCRALDEVADISVPGTKDHVKVQGEILEGLVARIVSPQSSSHLQKVLEEIPAPPVHSDAPALGPGLRELCAANNSSEQQQIKALLRNVGSAMCPDFTDWLAQDTTPIVAKADRSLVTKFLKCRPSDYSTIKLQEMIRLLKDKHFPADFKCRFNYRKFPYVSTNSVQFKMVIHIYNDSGFRRYQREMREHPGLWPLYRGFFVDVHLFKLPDEKTKEYSDYQNLLIEQMESALGSRTFEEDDLADEAENVMIKLKFLTYKLRTFLIRNGLPILFKQGPAAYRDYYLRQLQIWGTSQAKQKEMSKMLDEWAVYIRRKYGNRQIPSSSYLSEAEPFLEQYARKSPQNQRLIGSAGSFVRTEEFIVAGEKGFAEEGEFVQANVQEASNLTPSADKSLKTKGMIVFFPGIPGCAKSALCREILNSPDGLGDNRPINSLMGDLIKARYWQQVLDERRKKPSEIVLADKNAPNEEVWQQIEDMSKSTHAIAVPVVPSSEGTDTNPFSLDALAVFIYRVIQRVNHPGGLDKDSPNAGYVLMMFYNLYEGKTRKEFDAELRDRFGVLIKTPLLKPDRDPLPDSIKNILEEGLSLYKLHKKAHGKLDSTKGTYANAWRAWEKRLREVLFANADYLNKIQVPFEHVVKHVLEELRAIAKGDFQLESTEKRKLGSIVYAAVSIPANNVKTLLDKISEVDSRAKCFIDEKNVKESLNTAHVTLAHKRSHGVPAVASYGAYRGQNVPVKITALLYSDKLAALEAHVGSIGNERIESKNEWPHLTIWVGPGAAAKLANDLPRLVSEGKATRVDFKEPLTLTGTVDFF